MPLLRAKGLVLRNRPLGETDRLVTCFTLEHGKIAGVAKGAGRLRSRFGSSLQPLSLIRLMLFGKETRSLYRIDHTDILTSFQDIRDDWEKLRPALYAVDLVDALLAEYEEIGQRTATSVALNVCRTTSATAWSGPLPASVGAVSTTYTGRSTAT